MSLTPGQLERMARALLVVRRYLREVRRVGWLHETSLALVEKRLRYVERRVKELLDEIPEEARRHRRPPVARQPR